jgi:hypothetical protein
MRGEGVRHSTTSVRTQLPPSNVHVLFDQIVGFY